MVFKIFRIVLFFLTPAYVLGLVTWVAVHCVNLSHERMEFEIHKTIMQGQLKAMCIQAHACGDDCKEI